MKQNIYFCLVALLFSVTACNQSYQITTPQPDYWPTHGWLLDEPSNHGMDEAKLSQIESHVLEALDSLIIIRHGYIVYEKYYNGYDEATLHDVASVTKSWTSASVGVAQAQGKLTNLDEPIDVLLPEYFSENQHEDKREITLGHLLMMRSGIMYDEDTLNSGGYGASEELLGKDLVAFGLTFPVAHEPGKAWNYSTLDTQLISAIIQEATDESLETFAASHLFRPLGITQFEWLSDAEKVTIGGGYLQMTPRDMAKLGLLYLHQGVWEDKQLIPAEWIKSSLMPQGNGFYEPTGQTQQIDWYGYLWWTWNPDWFHGYSSFQARGYGGQQVLVFPEIDLIIVTTANIENKPPEVANQQEEEIYGLIREQIFPALSERQEVFEN